MSVANKLSHSREFTDIEDTTLDAWLLAENANLDERAARILDAGLMAEHFTSLLADDPDSRTPAELVMQAQLRAKLADEIRLLQDDLRSKAARAGVPRIING